MHIAHIMSGLDFAVYNVLLQELAEMTEALVLGLSSLEGEQVRAAFLVGLEMVLENRGGEAVHKLFWTQVQSSLFAHNFEVKQELLPDGYIPPPITFWTQLSKS